MARKTESRDIDGLGFSVTQLPGMRAQKMLPRLGKILGPAVAKLGGMAKGLGGLDVGALGDAAEALFSTLTPEEYESLTRELLETAQVTQEGKTAPLMRQYDDVMAGRVMTGVKLLAFALEVNFGDFLPVILASANAARVPQSASPTPS